MVTIAKKNSNRKSRVKFNSNISLPRQAKKINDSASLVLSSHPQHYMRKNTLHNTNLCYCWKGGSLAGQQIRRIFQCRDMSITKAEFTAKLFKKKQIPHNFQGQTKSLAFL